MNKKLLLFWSGGLDSTFLLYHLLSTTEYIIDTCYVEIENNDFKTKRELLARERIKYIFKNNMRSFNDLGTISKIFVSNVNCVSSFHQIPTFIYTSVMCANDYDEIALSYVMNDDAISYLDEIKQVFNSFKLIGYKGDNLFPTIIFPLSKWKKYDISLNMSSYQNYREVFDAITWCESTTDNCGVCAPCKRMIDDLYFKHRFTSKQITETIS